MRAGAVAGSVAGAILVAGVASGGLDASGAPPAAPLDVTRMTAEWTIATHGTPPLIQGSLAYDSARSRTVRYDEAGNTWEWDGTVWSFVTSDGPGGRTGAAMTFDAATGVTVLFGGRSGGITFADTWIWDGAKWKRVANAGPAPRVEAAIAYDAGRGVVVLFGGGSGDSENEQLNDVWEWNGAVWTQACTDPACQSAGPGPRVHATGTYDPSMASTLFFGGAIGGGTPLGELWGWDGVAWTALCTTAPCTNDVPPPTSSGSLAFDTAHGTALLYDSSTLETWGWSAQWGQLGTVGPPGSNGAMAYDIVRAEMVFTATAEFGRSAGGTWLFDRSWAAVAPTAPIARATPALAYDAARKQTVLFGGCDDLSCNDTWTWDGAAWKFVRPVESPPARGAPSVAYDSTRRVVTLFGGTNIEKDLNDTWEWDGRAWTLKCTAAPCSTLVPAARRGASLAFDSARGQEVLFGGNSCISTRCGDLSDTWEWDGTSWKELTPKTSPKARVSAAMAYDAAEGKTVLFGGYEFDASAEVSDTWEWDGSDWVERSPAHHPSSRDSATAAYDAVSQRVVLFGGNGAAAEYYGDLWTWDGSDWTQAEESTPSPNARAFMGLAYDTDRQRLVAFGGGTAGYTGVPQTPSEDGATWEFYFQGGTCSSSATCETGHCVDGACCTTASCGTCQTCAGSTGVCTAVVNADDPPSCTGTSTCDATGACKLKGAQACTGDAVCASGFCVDGVCCDSACGQECQACDVAPNVGTCSPVIGAPHGSRAACAGGASGGPCEALACDGQVAASCTAFVGSGVSCGAPSCSDGGATTGGTCDGHGNCASESTSCMNFACDPTGTACLTSCTTSADCVPGTVCNEASHQCSTAALCDGDHTVIAPNGVTKTNCAPYKCAGVSCRSTCGSALDCVSPDVCDVTGHCVTLPADNSYGGCDVAGHGESAPRAPLAGLGVLATTLLSRRRRRVR